MIHQPRARPFMAAWTVEPPLTRKALLCCCRLWDSVSEVVLPHLAETRGVAKHGFMKWFRPGVEKVGGVVTNLFKWEPAPMLCLLPAARQRLCSLPSYCLESQRWAWLHRSGGNATWPLLWVSVPAARLPTPSLTLVLLLCTQLSGGLQSGLVLMLLCLFLCL